MPPRFDAYVRYCGLLILGEGYMKRACCSYYRLTTILFSIQKIYFRNTNGFFSLSFMMHSFKEMINQQEQFLSKREV